MELKLSSLIFQAPAFSTLLNCLSGFSLFKNMLTLQVHKNTFTKENKNRGWTAFFRNFLVIVGVAEGNGNAWATSKDQHNG